MLLSRQNAQRIVQELNDVIGHKINMMDDAGIIVASSDPERIGEYHEGAGLILKQGLGELIVHRDGEYEGCREGVNYPLAVWGADHRCDRNHRSLSGGGKVRTDHTAHHGNSVAGDAGKRAEAAGKKSRSCWMKRSETGMLKNG